MKPKNIPYYIGYAWLFALLTGLTACERRELTYYTEAEVEIHADWSRAGLESTEYGATAVFYPTDGRAPKVVLMGDARFERARLPRGHYRVVLFNRSFSDFGNIAFRGNENLETIEAYAKQMESRVDEAARAPYEVITGSPEVLASDVIADFEVTEDMLGNYTGVMRGKSRASTGEPEVYALNFTPRPLIQKVEVTLHVQGLNNIRSAACQLDGVNGSVFLADGRLSDKTVIQQFDLTNIEFTNGSPFDGVMTTTFNLFGIDTDLLHRLDFTVLLVDGKTIHAESFENIKVTREEISTANAQVDVTVRLRIEVNLSRVPDVKPEGGSEGGFDAGVDDWGEEEKKNVPI